MRFRLMATYRGVPYEVGVGPSSSDVVLFAACPPPEELGFEPAPGHWRKRVIWAEVDVLWESRPVGSFHGDPCLVLDDLGDRLHIAYLGKDGRRARELGFWQVDRGVYELLTPREEVTGLNEEKVEKNLPRRGPGERGRSRCRPIPTTRLSGRPRRLRRPAGPAYAGWRPGLRQRAGHGPGRGLERQWSPGWGRELERQRDQPRRGARLECPRLPRRHRRLEPHRHPGQPQRMEPPRITGRHRGLESQRGTRNGGGSERARHGQLERHDRPGRDARRPGPAGAWPQAAGVSPAGDPPANSGFPPGPSSRNWLTWPRSRGRPTHWSRSPTAPCACCGPRKGSRSSVRPMAPGTRCALSTTRKPRTSTCSVSWPRKPCATAR